jgi:hypothetical protein
MSVGVTPQHSQAKKITIVVIALVAGICTLGGALATADEAGSAFAGTDGTVEVRVCEESFEGYSCTGPFTPRGSESAGAEVDLFLMDWVAPGRIVKAKLGPVGTTATVPGGTGLAPLWMVGSLVLGVLTFYLVRLRMSWSAKPLPAAIPVEGTPASTRTAADRAAKAKQTGAEPNTAGGKPAKGRSGPAAKRRR